MTTEPRSDGVSAPAGRWLGLEPEDARFGAILGLGTLAFLLFVGVIYPAPLPILFLGLILGSLSGLVAMGLVLIYRANRIINFAQGDLGGLAAVMAASLIVGPKWNFWLAIIAGLATALVLGFLTDVLVIRRFARAPRLVLTVATIGLAQVLGGGELLMPRLFGSHGFVIPGFATPLRTRVNVDPVIFTGNHLVIVASVPLVIAGLAWFLLRTDAGVAVRA
ncbi:MAG TPA: branched-chain amino acid ABC transporter permease, partial [Acidimicrobiales bacterium]|nr:branched-chain amino acid ABC transporter permease [Acidimicrobiales bacterium]